MIEFKRDKETGILYAYKDGRLVGPIQTMADVVNEIPSKQVRKTEDGADTVIRAARS